MAAVGEGPSGSAADITIMVSCYNEEITIVPTLERLVAALRASTLAAEIIVMDDRSQDGSVDAVRRFVAGVSDQRLRIRHWTAPPENRVP